MIPGKREKRQHRRVKLHYILKYQEGSGGGLQDIANVSDISVGGLSFLTKSPIKEGTQLILDVLIPPFPDPFKMEARVFRTAVVKKGKKAHYSIAVKFVKIKDKDQQHLSEFFNEVYRKNHKFLFIDLP